FANLSSVELRHTARDDEGLAFALGRGELAHRFHGLRLALLDESAGVDDDGVGLGGFDDRQEFAAGEDALEVFAIDVVLWTAQRDQVVRPGNCHQGPSLTASVTVSPSGWCVLPTGTCPNTSFTGAAFGPRTSFTTYPAASTCARPTAISSPTTSGTIPRTRSDERRVGK